MAVNVCGFCMQEVEIADGREPAKRCPKCGVGQCFECGTYIIGENPNFCYGCGEIRPATEAHLYSAGSYALVYVEEAWAKRNLGAKAGGLHTLVYSTQGTFVESPNGERRKITEEEAAKLKS